MAEIPIPHLVSVNSNKVNITLSAVHNIGGEYRNYEIFQQEGKGDTLKTWQSVANLSGSAQTFEASGLEPNTRYAFIVCGQMEPGNYTRCSTARSILTPPYG